MSTNKPDWYCEKNRVTIHELVIGEAYRFYYHYSFGNWNGPLYDRWPKPSDANCEVFVVTGLNPVLKGHFASLPDCETPINIVYLFRDPSIEQNGNSVSLYELNKGF